jgi:hypothetical protein
MFARLICRLFGHDALWVYDGGWKRTCRRCGKVGGHRK